MRYCHKYGICQKRQFEGICIDCAPSECIFAENICLDVDTVVANIEQKINEGGSNDSRN